MTDDSLSDVKLGRLFRLKLKRSSAARDAALQGIRSHWSGVPARQVFVARIGGRMRGRDVEFRSLADAERAIHDHYNAAMLEWVRRHG